jgi:hypothetical protein
MSDGGLTAARSWSRHSLSPTGVIVTIAPGFSTKTWERNAAKSNCWQGLEVTKPMMGRRRNLLNIIDLQAKDLHFLVVKQNCLNVNNRHYWLYVVFCFGFSLAQNRSIRVLF